ncbi:MAG: MBL fold metallo-hydrolase [Acidimicrobiales bacterium]
MGSDPEAEIGASAAVAPQPFGTGELAPGVVTVLSPRVRRIIAPNPSLMTGPGTGTYLVGQTDLAVIDPGPDDASHLDRIAEVGEGRIRWVVYTHTHQDHSPGVAGLVERTGATSVGFAPREGREDPVPVQAAADGSRVSLAGTTLRALHTPGHASNHLCWLLEEEAMLFSGDHIMNGSTVVIAPPDGDMTAYLDQLERLRSLGLATIAPGHGKLITDPAAKIDEYLSHRRARELQIEACLGQTPKTVNELVTEVYSEITEVLHPVARYSMWAHLRRLRESGRAISDDADDVDAGWTAGTGVHGTQPAGTGVHGTQPAGTGVHAAQQARPK